MELQKKKVFVGLSGGVDSSVSATLLLKEGYDVIGVFIKIWSPEWTECTSREDRLDAMRVCAHLRIPFKEIDLTQEYKKEVVDYMVSEYAKGRTPNPDVMCNRSIKFGTFFKWAIENGADFVATGHYAQTELGAKGLELRASADSGKDQTYFLWTLRQEQLEKILFPIGGLKKSEVRRLAKKFKLPTAEKKDSQGLCFIGHVDIKEFLSRYIPQKRGDVVNEKGVVIGYHDGATFLTIGERHGFTITKKTPRDAPLYIIKKNIERNTLTVGTKSACSDISLHIILLSELNWINGKPDSAKIYTAQVRYHGKYYRCRVRDNVVEFMDLPDATAPGQSLVVYDKDICLGGGIMEQGDEVMR